MVSGSRPRAAGRVDVHHERHVDQDRAGLVDADHLNGFVPIADRLADLLRLAVGVGVVAGDLGADQDVGLAHVGRVQEPPAAALRREQDLLEDSALEMQVLR